MPTYKTHHVQTKIESLLEKSDSELQDLFGGFAPDIRSELESRKSNSEVYVGSPECEGFCPVKGCPGHL